MMNLTLLLSLAAHLFQGAPDPWSIQSVDNPFDGSTVEANARIRLDGGLIADFSLSCVTEDSLFGSGLGPRASASVLVSNSLGMPVQFETRAVYDNWRERYTYTSPIRMRFGEETPRRTAGALEDGRLTFLIRQSSFEDEEVGKGFPIFIEFNLHGANPVAELQNSATLSRFLSGCFSGTSHDIPPSPEPRQHSEISVPDHTISQGEPSVAAPERTPPRQSATGSPTRNRDEVEVRHTGLSSQQIRFLTHDLDALIELNTGEARYGLSGTNAYFPFYLTKGEQGSRTTLVCTAEDAFFAVTSSEITDVSGDHPQWEMTIQDPVGNSVFRSLMTAHRISATTIVFRGDELFSEYGIGIGELIFPQRVILRSQNSTPGNITRLSLDTGGGRPSWIEFDANCPNTVLTKYGGPVHGQ